MTAYAQACGILVVALVVTSKNKHTYRENDMERRVLLSIRSGVRIPSGSPISLRNLPLFSLSSGAHACSLVRLYARSCWAIGSQLVVKTAGGSS